MKINRIFILVLMLTVLAIPHSWAQKKVEKLSERFNVNDNVVVTLDTQYTDVVVENWNKDVVEIEAYLDTDGLTDQEIKQIISNWRIGVQGNSKQVRINSASSQGVVMNFPNMPEGGLEALIQSSMSVVEPVMNGLVTPLLESFAGNKLPPEYYQGMRNIKFDFDEYRKHGEAYLEEYNKKVEANFGKDFEKAMEKWTEENENNRKGAQGTFFGMPKSPFGNHLSFDSDEYKTDKKTYVARLNKKYGTNASVKEVDAWLENLEQWGESFGEGMEAWGEKFGEKFGKSMEAWGENFGRDMESWGDNLGKQMEQWAKQFEGDYKASIQVDENGNQRKSYSYHYDSTKHGTNSTPSKVGNKKIIIRMPASGQINFNVRHGNVNLDDVNNGNITVSHGGFTAKNVGGDKTYVTVSYSPVDVENWGYGTLNTSYVKNCLIKKAESINLNSKSSNVIINEIAGTAYISGSFGELTLPKIGRGFKGLNISLENSDLILKLPDTPFHFNFNGTRSNLNYPEKLEAKAVNNYDSKMVNGFYKSRNTDSAITITARFSDVVVN